MFPRGDTFPRAGSSPPPHCAPHIPLSCPTDHLLCPTDPHNCSMEPQRVSTDPHRVFLEPHRLHIGPHRDITSPVLGAAFGGGGKLPGRRGPLGSIMWCRQDREGWGSDRWMAKGSVRGEGGGTEDLVGRDRQETEGQWDIENLQGPGGHGGGGTMGDVWQDTGLVGEELDGWQVQSNGGTGQ